MTQYSREYLYTGRERNTDTMQAEVCKTCKYCKGNGPVYKVVLQDLAQCELKHKATGLQYWCPNYKKK